MLRAPWDLVGVPLDPFLEYPIGVRVQLLASAFLGWGYGRLGFDASPGETIGLRFSNQGDRAVDATLPWRLESYIGDEIARVVSWKGNTDVSALAGKAVRLRFILKDADLYSIRFRE